MNRNHRDRIHRGQLPNPIATYRQAVTLHTQGRALEADALCAAVLRSNPKHFGALHLQGLIALRRGEIERGLGLINRSLEICPEQPAAHCNFGNALLGLKRPQQALTSLERALQLQPAFAIAWYNRGNALRDLGRVSEALESYDRALQLQSDHALFHNNRGVVLIELNRCEEALSSFERTLHLSPDFAEAHKGRGTALLALGRTEEALQSYSRATRLLPEDPDAYCCVGNALFGLKRFEEARASFCRALQLNSDHFSALVSRGQVLQVLRCPDEALVDFQRALQLMPASVSALNHCATALLDLRRIPEALDNYDQILRREPGNADALHNRGAALLLQRQPQAALEAFDEALRVKADRAETFLGRAHALAALDRSKEARDCLEEALRANPEIDFLMGEVLHARLSACDWAQFEHRVSEIEEALEKGSRAIDPMAFIGISQSAAAQRRCARICGAAGVVAGPPKRGRGYGHKRIRVAYLSGDLREHAVSYLMAGVFEKHNRERFEPIAISFRPQEESSIGRRLRAAFPQFVVATDMGDHQIASLVRELEVDIAVDLMGYTHSARSAVFAHRPAPVQINYLGFPATMGSTFMDYILGDAFVIPAGSQKYYAEKVVHLPDCFQANDDGRIIGAMPTRAEMGLPQFGFVFCCFNNSYKFNPGMFDIWCRLLQAVAGSVLWLAAGTAEAAENLRRAAKSRGVDPQRLIMAERMPYAQHMGRMGLADLFLDTLPFNAGTTASDALWAGLPVLTCAGEAFASRMAGSLLQAIGIPELISYTLQDYEQRALELTLEPGRLNTLKEKLARNRSNAPLFDTGRFCRHLEAAYMHMWERAERGLPPEGFAVDPTV